MGNDENPYVVLIKAKDTNIQSCKSLTSIEIAKNVISIGVQAFFNCSSLEKVYYTGTEDESKGISIASGNTSLTSATIYYYSAAKPTEEGNYWYYDEKGTISIW